MTQTLMLWSPRIGDVPFNAQQAALVGASFGNGAASGSGQNPNNLLQMGDDGNLVVSLQPTGISPSATALDKILAIMTIPAGGFDLAGRGVNIMAAGNCPNNNAKTIKVIINPTNAAPILTNGSVTVTGGTTIATSTMTGAGSTGGWNVAVNLFKYGAPGSNTQLCIHEAGQAGSIVGVLSAPSLTTFAENAAMVVAITGNSGTTAGDIVYNYGSIFAMN